MSADFVQPGLSHFHLVLEFSVVLQSITDAYMDDSLPGQKQTSNVLGVIFTCISVRIITGFLLDSRMLSRCITILLISCLLLRVLRFRCQTLAVGYDLIQDRGGIS